MTMESFYTYIITSNSGYDVTEKSEYETYFNMDQIVSRRDLHLNFKEDDSESVDLSKVTFSNGECVFLATSDINS